MRAYSNVVLDIIENFTEYNFVLIPREQNAIVDSLASSANFFKIPIGLDRRYEIEVKHSSNRIGARCEGWK